jgi:hypothetical protein
LNTGRIECYPGPNPLGFEFGAFLFSVCADPTRKNRYWIANASRILCLEGNNLSVVAGSQGKTGFIDGDGSQALFYALTGCAITDNGESLFVCDCHNNRIRQINTKSGSVTTVAGDGVSRHRDGADQDPSSLTCSIAGPRKCAWYQAPKVRPNSVLFITAGSFIRRLDLDSATLTTSIDMELALLGGITCTSVGIIVFTCFLKHSVYTHDPMTKAVERIVGTGGRTQAYPEMRDGEVAESRFDSLQDVYVDEISCCLWTLERTRVRCITLPPYIFGL